MVYQLSLNLLGDHNEALDLSQEVFLRVFRTIHAVSRPVGPAHLDLPHSRQSGPQPAALVAAAPSRRSRCRSTNTLRDHGDFPERNDLRVARPACSGARSSPNGFGRALEELPFDQKTALVLREIDGLSYDEIGFSLGYRGRDGQVPARSSTRSIARAIEGRMTLLTCVAVRRRLPAFHDRELPIPDQIAIESHISGCPPCAGELEDIRQLGDVLRCAAAPGPADDWTGLQSGVISRMRAEAHEAWTARTRPHVRRHAPRVDWIRLGGRHAGLRRCWRSATLHVRLARARRLAGGDDCGDVGARRDPISTRLRNDQVPPGAHGTRARPGRVRPGAAGDSRRARAGAERRGDAATGECRACRSSAPSRTRASSTRSSGALSTARLEPGRLGASPVAVNLVWLLAHTTVKAKAPRIT